MQHSQTAADLVEILSDLRGIQVSLTCSRCEDGRLMWTLDGLSEDGQVWRAQHHELVGAATLLSDLLLSTSPGMDT